MVHLTMMKASTGHIALPLLLLLLFADGHTLPHASRASALWPHVQQR